MKYSKLLDNLTGEPALYKTFFKMKVKKDKLIFKFIAFHCSMNSYSAKYNDDIFKGDVCEVFLYTGRENKYWEIEVSPNKTIFFAEITNVNGNFTGDRKPYNPVKLKSYRLLNVVYHKLALNFEDLDIQDKNIIEYNAFRIETDGEKPEKHLFALFPTLSNTFHVRKAFKKYYFSSN